MLVETYYSYSYVQDLVDEYRRRFFPLFLLGLLALALLQVPLALALVRRMAAGQRERDRLLHRAIGISDSERRRIAAEVHDGAVQDLIGVGFALAGRAETAPAPLGAELADLSQATMSTVRTLRGLLASIYPVAVPEGGWVAGIDDLLDELRARDVEVIVDVVAERPPHLEELLVLRTAREALRNVIGHAKAVHVTVRSRAPRHRVDARGDRRRAGLRPRGRRAARRAGPSRHGLAARPGHRCRCQDEHPFHTRARHRRPARSRGSNMIRVLLVDDHAMVRSGLESFIGSAADIEVIGAAANGREAIDLASTLHPDVILMDLLMPVMGGIDAIRELKVERLDRPDHRPVDVGRVQARQRCPAGRCRRLPREGRRAGRADEQRPIGARGRRADEPVDHGVAARSRRIVGSDDRRSARR